MTSVQDRKRLLRQIERERNSKAVLYVTGNRHGMEAQIGNDIIDLVVDHLDAIGPVQKISLILHTSGGDSAAAWNLVNLFHMFCEEFEVIAPSICRSAGTLIALGADRIVMTKQATLGPIDPSIQHPLGPSIPGASPEARASVSVEAVNGYLDAIRSVGKDKNFEAQALLELTNKVHPLVLGQIFRSRQQIRNLAERLLSRAKTDNKKIRAIVDFLCSDSGSHDYTINRREAASLGMLVEKPPEKLYAILRRLHSSYSSEMSLRTPFALNTVAVQGQSTQYRFLRAVIESPTHGAHHFLTEGTVVSTQIQVPPQPGLPAVPQVAIQDTRNFDGWRKVA